MKNNKVILILIIIIILLLGVGALYVHSLKEDIKEANLSARLEKLRGDRLEVISTTQARKLVADSLTQRELNRLVKELEIALDAKPKIVWKTEFIIEEVEKEIDGIVVDSTSVAVDDYFPQKEGYFIRYQNRIDLLEGKGKSNWSFSPLTISGVISQRKDDIYTIDFKAPEWLEIASIDVQATPLETPKRDNFGVLLGGGAGYDFRSQEVYGRLSGDIRFKKFYIGVGAGTNQTVDGGIKIEF